MWLSLLKIFNLNNLKTIAIIAGIVAAIWFYKDYQHQKAENKRQTENIVNIRRADSLHFASQTYTKKELNEYLEYTRKDLQKFLNKNNINTRRIEKIITQKLAFQDHANRSTDLQPILDAIRNQQKIRVPVIDSTRCMIIKGWVVFDGDSLTLNITDRQFKNRSDVISYWERNQWKLLGIKTRLFGKKTITVIIKDDCGRTETFVIDKRK